MRIFSALVILCLATLISSCSFRGIHTRHDLPYVAEQNAFGLPELLLDVYSPKKVNDAEVLIFIHGGSWNSGHKETYRFFGKRMARRGVVAVIINYPLSPAYQIQSMVTASKLAADWTYKNISEYRGSPEKIFVSGHSAGGHLASVIAVREELFVELGTVSPIKGAVLIDAAGFDMKWFLEQMNYEPGSEFLIPFTDDPEVWKEVSPIYFLRPGT
jgi:acetyl esterase/lipase